jgi:HD-GYP domain-containing protein (c-di-GMP phosphodiesterase class II)
VLEEALAFLSEVNRGGEPLTRAGEGRIRALASRRLVLQGKEVPLLTPEEVETLCIPQGTLSLAERKIIQDHVRVTDRMLSQLPFPKRLRQVPRHAADHHEALNGKGYPRGRKQGEISLQSRIIALADVFEALTAKDRPYKKGKTLSEVLAIMESMAGAGQIDPDLFVLFRQEGLHLDYARRELTPQQIDLEN